MGKHMTKKYAAVYQPLVERLEAENGHKKGPDSIKAVKTKLHQLYGAYTQDNAYKKAAVIISALEAESARCCEEPDSARHCEERSDEATAASLLSLHASTKERLLYYAEFYNFIFSHTGLIESVLDIGCGYNPFSIPLMPAANLNAYHAYDIDMRVADLLNRFFACMRLPPLAKCADLAVHIPRQRADIALMCKLVPVLEAQAPGSGYRLARELNTRHLLITYPLKSLGGREKGMAKHYAAAFEKALADGELGEFELVADGIAGAELLYLLRKNRLTPIP